MREDNEESAETPVPLFKLGEYHAAGTRFLGDAIEALARAQNPLFAKIPVANVEGPIDGQITTDDGEEVELVGSEVGAPLAWKLTDIMVCDFDELLASLAAAGETYANSVMQMVYRQIFAITEATGNVQHVTGPLTWDDILASLEQIEWSFDRDGNPNFPDPRATKCLRWNSATTNASGRSSNASGRSTVLRVVLAGFLSSLPNERAFDEPFKALLRQRGFYDIHLLHGAFEFGKDFIAKKDTATGPQQWAFQTKAGNIGKSDWQGIRNQLEEIRTNSIGHPNLDPDHPPVPVLVFTGRMVGQAATSAQQYNEWLEKIAQPKVEHWNGDHLLDLFLDPASAFVETSADGELLGLVGDIDAGRCSDRRIEQFSRRWMTKDPDGFGASALEAAVGSAALPRTIASTWPASARWRCCAESGGPRNPRTCPLTVWPMRQPAAREIFMLHAEALWQTRTEDHLDPLYFINVHQNLTAFVTYPVRCARLVELLGLLALLRRGEGDDAADDAITDYLARFIAGQPGVRHLLSDHWAASLTPAVLTHRTKASGTRTRRLARPGQVGRRPAGTRPRACRPLGRADRGDRARRRRLAGAHHPRPPPRDLPRNRAARSRRSARPGRPLRGHQG